MSNQKSAARNQKSSTRATKQSITNLQSPLLSLFLYTLLTLILTHPLIFNLAASVPNDIGDPLLNTWILAWDNHAFLTDPLNLFNANIFYPLPHTLAYSEHLFSTALLALPLQVFTAEPVAAYNLSLLLSFPLAAFGMYLLALRWTHQHHAAFIAGLIFAFNPYRFAAIAHLQLLTYHWLPFTILSLDLLLRPSPSLRLPRLSLLSALFLTLQLLASWYLALYALLITGLYLLWQRHYFTRFRLIILSCSFLISFCLTLPLAWPYLSVLDDLRAARPLSQALALAAAPTDLAAAAPFNRIFGPLTEALRNRPAFTEENTLFTGIIAPLLVLCAILLCLPSVDLGFTKNPKRSTFYALLLVLLVSLALTFSTPYAWLAHLIPPSTIVRVPPRWIIPALFALAGLAAFGYTGLTWWVKRFSFIPRSLPFIFFTTLLLAESLSIPLPLAAVENRASLNPAYHWLAAQPGDLALIELPLHSAPAPEYPEVKRLYASTLGWWKLVNGYSGYTPSRQPQLALALADFPGPASITALQQVAFQPSTLPTFLLIHPGELPFDRTRWENTERWLTERNPALLPLGQFNGDYLYHVIPPDPTRFTAPPVATFGPDHSIQLLGYTLSSANVQRSTFNVSPFIIPPSSFILLYWRSTTPLPADYTIFLHLRAPDGFVRSGADSPSVSGHYATSMWQPGEVIQDSHPLPNPDFDHLALGLYDPATGARLPAFAAQGQPLPDNALIIR